MKIEKANIVVLVLVFYLFFLPMVVGAEDKTARPDNCEIWKFSEMTDMELDLCKPKLPPDFQIMDELLKYQDWLTERNKRVLPKQCKCVVGFLPDANLKDSVDTIHHCRCGTIDCVVIFFAVAVIQGLNAPPMMSCFNQEENPSININK